MDVLSLNQRFIRELLELYRELPAVWRIKSAEYKNKMAKARAYELLVQKCREYVPNADREFVKTKINSLRTSFRKEFRKVQTSQATAKNASEVYVPNLWYYHMLTFTVENENCNYAVKNDMSETSFIDDDDEDDSRDDSLSMGFKTEPSHIVLDKDPLSTADDQSTLPKKKSKVEILTSAKSSIIPEDVFDAIGKNVAHKLRGMSQQQRIIAEKIISDVMYHGQMETLTIDAHLSLSKSS